ncbi:TIM44-like domain-containing protein [Candidatus Accumulibacter vicinus]|uniref:Tim44-like domain protein n=1 Tax=Candidatus Accumulibacter vicinus TaxID=2954382 RepID=A0A084Y579_9PROT|nr:TIM44-like domain-containing protein [Candidatus Accumulibacter vicinus]KFB69873.1 MAG: Tim44-like domain protein [Candidatus Accumulibacter vicinus]
MKKILMTLGICVFSLGLAVGEADAKRLGGGSSSGMQRDSVTQRQATPPLNAVTPAPAATAPAAAPKRNWMGPLAGLAAGLGIAALLSHFGLGESMANFLMIALLLMCAVVAFKLLFRRKGSPVPDAQPLQYAGAGAAGMVPTPQAFNPAPATGLPVSPAVPLSANIAAGFDVDGFLRVAKLNFIRLQAANDAGNLDDIREFVTPEMYAEIKLQFDERGKATQQTDVVTLNAVLLEVVTEADRHIASVRFSGMIREEAGAVAAPFDEVWNLTKAVDGASGWVIAGIQQLS